MRGVGLRWFLSAILLIPLACTDSAPDDLLEPTDPLHNPGPADGPPPDPGDGSDPEHFLTEEEAARITIRGSTSATMEEVTARTYVPVWARIIPAYFMENEITATITADGSSRTLSRGPDRSATGYNHETTMRTGTSCAQTGSSGYIHAESLHRAEFRYSIGLPPLSVPYQKPHDDASDDDYSCEQETERKTEPADDVCSQPYPDGGHCADPNTGSGVPTGGGAGPPPQPTWCEIEVTYYRDSGIIIDVTVLYCY